MLPSVDAIVQAGAGGALVLLAVFAFQVMRMMMKRDEQVIATLITENGKLHASVAAMEQKFEAMRTEYENKLAVLRDRMFAAEEQEAQCLGVQVEQRAQITVLNGQVAHLTGLLNIK